jgi:DNA invertase Pin-like site-specific DNA recombinase
MPHKPNPKPCKSAPLPPINGEKPEGRLIGYVRVSTAEQNTDLQYDALVKAGCAVIYEDKITGVSRDRTGLDAAMLDINVGDKLVVWRLDRLGRSIPHIMTIVAELGERGASLYSIGEGFDTGNEAGELYSTILAMIAHVERRMIVSRTRAGLAAAKERGVKIGAPRKMTQDQVKAARIMMKRGIKAHTIAFDFGIGRATLFRYLGGKIEPITA